MPNENQLSGEIPHIIGMLPDVESLDLAANNLSGSIPKDLGGCSKLIQLNLENNKFEGSIPWEITNMNSLKNLDFSSNLLTGEMPPQLAEMKRLETLNLSHNNLSGFILSKFDEMKRLTMVDISFNQLEGPIPNSNAFREASFEAFRNNKGLSGYAAVCHFALMVKGATKEVKKTNIPDDQETQNQNMFEVWNLDGKMVYENIIEAMEEFNSKYCNGEGGTGSVYKAELSTGQVVAVKKFHTNTNDDDHQKSQYLKAFTSEVHALTQIRHLNIVKLYGFFSHRRHSLLVYEFIEGGSLRNVLMNNDEEARAFGWNKKVNVVKGVANALSFMHRDCSPPIIHRDISIPNILLNAKHDEARVSDFGMARLLKPH
ncbi:MDIS1-interacting receptor like kinase 2-like [Ziziphus jujuba]|uniref:non-specific serine/threonine protein kinase n=1 Tax=Ziziphus jujuba TaxID=326968 RepID=A0ABM3ZTS9_ZIZJJ|nr:MDIS1-interacting receptor like kinase 2-like [Ziziphus jujuba]